MAAEQLYQDVYLKYLRRRSRMVGVPAPNNAQLRTEGGSRLRVDGSLQLRV